MNKDEAREAAVQSEMARHQALADALSLPWTPKSQNTYRTGFERGYDAGAASVDRRAIVDRWQSMESAPKTGEHIQVINVDGHGFGFCGGKRQHASDIVHWFVDGFYSSIFGTDQETPMTFTHWRPLPDKDAVLAEMGGDDEH